MIRRAIWLFLALVIGGIALGGARHQSAAAIAWTVFIILALAWVTLPRRWQAVSLRPLRRMLPPVVGRVPGGLLGRVRPPADPLVAVRRTGLRAGGGAYLGKTKHGARHARSERAVLVLGPPRSGKSSAVVIPALIAHSGPAVSTSTKPDVAQATMTSRSRAGRIWIFDPTATAAVDPALELRWSPVASSVSWDGALLTARAMTATVGAGTTDRSHWAHRAQALLAPLLHAAAVHGRDMRVVVEWVMRHEINEPGVLLEDDRCADLAFSSLLGVHHTEARERSSIFSAAADALQAYTSQHALNAASDPNFDPAAFAGSQDTVYIHAPAEHQAAVAPIVCGLLSEIRRATYHAHATGRPTRGRMLFALDEVANIAPLEELPQIASEGGGQGLMLVAALQDLSQARHRWGAQADGFLTLFGTKLILRGVADKDTLEAVSTMLGEYDRRMVSRTQPNTHWLADMFTRDPIPHATTTYATQRTARVSPGDVARIPAGQALHLDGVGWELVTLTPAHQTDPWRALTQPAHTAQ